MKKIFALPLVVVFAAACSESTAPATDVSSPSVRAIAMSTSCDVNDDCFTFDGSVTASGGSSFSATTTTAVPVNSSDRFLGRFTNEDVNLFILGATGTTTVNFDLYIVGTWDGDGGHKYGPDTWEFTAWCGTTLLRTETYSFANKKTTLQSYPDQLGAGSNKGLTGAFGIGLLGFGDATSQRTTNHSVSSYDAVYRFAESLTCTGDLTIRFHSPSNQLQLTYDESWGLDNVAVVRQ